MSSPFKYNNGVPGGFVAPKQTATAPKKDKTEWTAEEDNQLLQWFLERTIAKEEWAIIATSFPEKPSINSVQQRVAELRQKRKENLEHSGVYPFNESLHADAIAEYAEELAGMPNDPPASSTAPAPSQTVRSNNKRKQPSTALDSNDTQRPAKVPRRQTGSTLQDPSQAAPPESWMPADGLAAVRAVDAALQARNSGAAATIGGVATTAGNGAVESGRERPVGVEGTGMGGGAPPAGETALTATNAGRAGTGGNRVCTVEDVQAESGMSVEDVAEILTSIKREKDGL